MNVYQQAVKDALTELSYRQAMDEDTTEALAELRRAQFALATHMAPPENRKMERQVHRGKRARARKSRANYGAESQANSGVALTLGALALLAIAGRVRKGSQASAPAHKPPRWEGTAHAIRTQRKDLPPPYWKGQCQDWEIVIRPSSLLSQGYGGLFDRKNVANLASHGQASSTWLEWDAYLTLRSSAQAPRTVDGTIYQPGGQTHVVAYGSSIKALVDQIEEKVGISMDRCRSSRPYKKMAALEAKGSKGKKLSYEGWAVDDHWGTVNDAHHRWDEGELTDEEAHAIMVRACGGMAKG
jgi:hypothetical protein